MRVMKAYTGGELHIRTFLISILDGVQVTLAPLSAHSRAKSARYPFHKRLGGLQNRSRCFTEGIIFYLAADLTLDLPTLKRFTIMNMLCRP
jgi:hypothetical protein